MAGNHICQTKPYHTVEAGFVHASLQDFTSNYSHSKKFSKTDWMCRCKKEVEEEGHIVSEQCEVYWDLRSQFGNLQEDKNLVNYYQAVLDRRDSLEEEDRR